MKRNTKIVAAFLVTVMLLSMLLPILPMSVSAAGETPTAGQSYMIVSKKNGKAMTVAGDSLDNNAAIVMMPAEAYASQVWTLEDGGNGTFILVNRNSARVMNVPNNSADAGTQIIQWNNDRSDNEKWSITEIEDGYYRITPIINPDYSLNIYGNSNDDGADIVQWWFEGGNDNELWSFLPVDEINAPELEEPDAVRAYDRWLEMFYYEENGKGYLNNSPWYGFWTDAECFEVMVDAYERFGGEKYKTVISRYFDGFIERRGDYWSYNDYNDDIMWMVIASTRAYLLTGEQKYLDVAVENFDMCYGRAWDTSFLDGGLWWREDHGSKNACVNGPGAIAAYFLGQATSDETYYDKAQAIVDWEIETLFNKDTGVVLDNIETNGVHNNWPFTYNQGTFIGACAMMYQHTGDDEYLECAMAAAEYATTMGNDDGLLSIEGHSGDLIGFKGILGRWLGYFARECDVSNFDEWMYENAKAAWNNRNSDDLMWTLFGDQTEENLESSWTWIGGDGPMVMDIAAWGSSAALSWLINSPTSDLLERWSVASPDGGTVMDIAINADGKLSYSATQDGVTVVETSDLGIKTSVGDFTKGLTFVSADTVEINETYDVISGKKSEYVNHCNETTLHFTKDGVDFDLVVRAYDDGIAFRYLIDTEEGGAMTVAPNAEKTSFNLPSGSRFWYMNRTNADFMYENEYESAVIGEAGRGLRPSMPMLYEVGDKYGLVMEADRHGNYVGSLLQLESGGVMRTIFDLVQTTAVESETPFASPWRTVIIGSAAEIMENTMVENLSPAADEETYKFSEWVEPGLSSWSWVSYYGGQTDPDIHKHFIDLAADMGWTYYILDEQWQPGSNSPNSRYEGMWDWFDDVRDYANEKGVKLIAWVHMDDVNTDAEREERFKEWSEAGIAGIKVDFFYNESQDVLQLHDDIYADAAKYKLLVNVHGSNPSSGEIRTWPNVITREAIRGQEQGGITVEQYTLIPFIRAAVGSADVTEQLFSRDTGKTTMGFQIALSTLIQNGLHSMGSKPEEYASVPAAISLYTDFPATWDDMYVIGAEVGEQVSVARRSGDLWYAAGISVDERDFTVSTEFLDPDKTYVAVIYQEVSGERQAIEMRYVANVTSESTLPEIAVQNGGGYAIKFVPQGESDLGAIIADSDTLSVELGFEGEIKLSFDPSDTIYADVIWTVEDDTVAEITPSASGATIKGLKEGTTTVTATSVYDDGIKAVITVTVTPSNHNFDLYEMEDGEVNGGAYVDNPAASNGQHIGNLGGATAGTVTFEVESETEGKATLKVYYGTWSDRWLSVTVNGEVYSFNCPSTGDWNTIGEPIELEVEVVKGRNTIVFSGTDGADAPNLDCFELITRKADVTPDVPDDGGEQTPDDGGEQTPDDGGEQTPDGDDGEQTPDDGAQTPDDGGEQTPDDDDAQTPDDDGEQTPDDDGEQTPDDDGEQTPDDDGEQTPDDGGEQTPDDGGEQTPDDDSEQTPDDDSEQTPDDDGDQTPDDGGEQTPDDDSEQTPDQDDKPAKTGDSTAITAMIAFASMLGTALILSKRRRAE